MKRIIILLLLVPAFCLGQKNKYDSLADAVKKSTPVNIKAGWDFGFALPLITAFKINGHVRINEHQLTASYFRSVLPVVGNQPEDIYAVTYSHVMGGYQPFAGWSNKGFSYGINKYMDNALLTAGVFGDVATISFTAGNLEKITNDWLNKRDWGIIGLQLIAGAARGAREANIAGHWGSGRFADYSISWKNKYKDWDNGDTREAFIGSKTIFVGFTDAYHLTGNIEALAHAGTLVVAIGGKSDWKSILKTLGISVIANRAAYYSSYYIIFK